jgi:putative ABC transport system ATP-binding protein
VLDEFARIADEGVAVVAVTHDEQVNRVADRVVTLVDGRVDPSEAGGAGWAAVRRRRDCWSCSR